MRCPVCEEDNDRVTNTRTKADGLFIYRVRLCSSCGFHWPTIEVNIGDGEASDDLDLTDMPALRRLLKRAGQERRQKDKELEAQGKRRCRECRLVKPLSEFRKGRRCTKCDGIYQNLWRSKNPGRYRAYNRTRMRKYRRAKKADK